MENVILRNIIFKHMDKLRSIYTLVILIVVAISSTSCSDNGVEDILSSNSAEFTIDGKRYVIEKGVSVGEDVSDNGSAVFIYEFLKSQSELFFQLNTLKGKRISGTELKFEDVSNVVNSVIKLDADTPGLISKSGTIKIVSDKEIQLIGCIYFDEDTNEEVAVEGTIKFDAGTGSEYCTATGTDAAPAWIESVLVSRESPNVSGSDDGYGDYTYLQYKLSVKNRRSLTLTPGYGSADLFVHWKVFVDFNDNGDFSDEGETIVMSDVASMGEYQSPDFKLPNATNDLRHRMRIIMKVVSDAGAVNDIDGCTDVTQGEVEDYTVLIRNRN